MLKKSFTFFLVLFLSVILLNAQDLRQAFEKAPRPIFENDAIESTLPSSNPLLPHSVTAVLIGKMWNAYATQASYTNQIYTDPFSGLIGVIKRVDRTGAGSGRIVYHVSDDGGSNWSPQIGPMNLAPWVNGRHPNLVLSNPTKSTTPGDQTLVAGWAELSASWYWYQFAKDDIGQASFTQYIDSVFYPGDEMFVNSVGHVFAPIDSIPPIHSVLYTLFKSTDKGTTWQKEPIANVNDFDAINGMKSFINKHGIGYIVAEARQVSGQPYKFAYKRTTDDGATWDADWTWVDVYNIPGIKDSVHALNYEVDAIVDGQGRLHFAGTFVDTIDGSATGIYLVSGSPTHGWQASFISHVNVTSRSLPGGLSTLNEIEFATNWDGDIVVLKWCDVPNPGDTLYDVFMMPVLGGVGGKVNITNTPNVHEKFSQTSAYGYMVNPTTFRVDCMYTIFGAGDTNDLLESELWYLSGVTFTKTSVDDNLATPLNFQLEQNFPNPFNPSTKIRFTIPERNHVTLKVYDVLGREIATLLNEIKDAGIHSIDFAGNDLPSGTYIYTLTSGNYSASKKMMLVK